MTTPVPPAAGFGGVSVTYGGMLGRTVSVSPDLTVTSTPITGEAPTTLKLDAKQGAELIGTVERFVASKPAASVGDPATAAADGPSSTIDVVWDGVATTHHAFWDPDVPLPPATDALIDAVGNLAD